VKHNGAPVPCLNDIHWMRFWMCSSVLPSLPGCAKPLSRAAVGGFAQARVSVTTLIKASRAATYSVLVISPAPLPASREAQATLWITLETGYRRKHQDEGEMANTPHAFITISNHQHRNTVRGLGFRSRGVTQGKQ
jgi:hypothetical protein